MLIGVSNIHEKMTVPVPRPFGSVFELRGGVERHKEEVDRRDWWDQFVAVGNEHSCACGKKLGSRGPVR